MCTPDFLAALAEHAPDGFVTRAQAKSVATRLCVPSPNWLFCDRFYAGFDRTNRSGRPAKRYRVPTFEEVMGETANMKQDKTTGSDMFGPDVMMDSVDAVPYVPSIDPLYVPWGPWEQATNLLKSGQFLPMMFSGPSGNGKTTLCEQMCAALGREFVRVNITKETDEDDLLGGLRLVGGDTKFALGPIPMAMIRGAVLLLDEVDLGGASLMCLQPVLEGKPLYLKKIRRFIIPAPGFTVLLSGNTKGRGDESGTYVHTQFLNEAMLERIVVLYNMEWPTAMTETRILSRLLEEYKIADDNLSVDLVTFAQMTRVRAQEAGVLDVITTRRLIHTIRVYAAMGESRNINDALQATLSRYDAATFEGFKLCWDAVHKS